ncbi:MAG: hypothetical protein ACOVSW_25140 [Candidatus Kapaibacteriota bacterium]|jgi:hypothetical protein
MSTSASAQLRSADLERSISVLVSIKRGLTINLDLRHIEEAQAHSLYLLDEELQRKQRELAEVQAGLHT